MIGGNGEPLAAEEPAKKVPGLVQLFCGVNPPFSLWGLGGRRRNRG